VTGGKNTTKSTPLRLLEIFMRKVIDPQLQIGEQDIGAIRLDPKSRDDIPQILLGLQHIYTTRAVREAVFAILEDVLPQHGGEGGSHIQVHHPSLRELKNKTATNDLPQL